MTTVLIIGYGNLSRRDDGVAFHIIARLRRRLGLTGPLDEDEPDTLGEQIATMLAHQLGPEMAETLARYDVVVFIDAHVAGTDWSPVHWQEIAPALRSSMVSHHLKPGVLLSLAGSLYGHAPRGYALSVLGADFDFGETLAPDTSKRADEAVERLLDFLHVEGVIA